MVVRVDEEEWQRLREEAFELEERSKQLVCDSQRAYKRNDKSEAKSLSNLAKVKKQLAVKAHKLAADKIFQRNNEGCDSHEIDLHGLLTNEVEERLNHRINQMKQTGSELLVVIVGKGIHSKKGPQLKKAVEAYAKKRRIKFTTNVPNEGCICFEFDASDRAIERPPGVAPQRNRTDRRPNRRDTVIEMQSTAVERETPTNYGKWICGIVAIIVVVLVLAGSQK